MHSRESDLYLNGGSEMRRVLTWIVVASATLSSPSHAVVTHNRLATNALTTGALTADPSADELLSTREGRDLYSYVVSCALPAGTDIHATVPGAPDTDPSSDLPYTCTSEECVFSGLIGLVPKWSVHKLSRKEQEWISACLLARVSSCHAVSGLGKWPKARTYRQVITTYVRQ